jgi:subtilase family serine protease
MENCALARAAPLLVALAVAACNAGGTPNVPSAAPGAPALPQWLLDGEAQRACPEVPPNRVRCDVLLSNRARETTIEGWVPADFSAAYRLPPSGRNPGQVVAVVDAYDNPNAAHDLAKYRTTFHLGPVMFTKYNQKGEMGDYPAPNSGWGVEEDLDIEMVSAACPNCTIYLIEAKSDFSNDLEVAESTAEKLGATIISNSWGCGTGSAGCIDLSYFDSSGVVYVASAGDYGYGAQAPAALPTVVAVGGTVLSKSGSTYDERVWHDSGAGCADGQLKPTWQHDPDCTYRTMNDVSAVAKDAAEFDTYHHHGWILVDGTSIAAPLIAGIYGLAGNPSEQNAGAHLWMLPKKRSKRLLHDISSGSVAGCPTDLRGTYLCSAGTGEFRDYSAPAGWGTPNGINAF